jgi:hypothetical protein
MKKASQFLADQRDTYPGGVCAAEYRYFTARTGGYGSGHEGGFSDRIALI